MTTIPKSKKRPPQGSRTRARAQRVLAKWGPTCWICREAINLDLKFPHPYSYVAGHLTPSDGTPATEGDHNLRPMHHRCNLTQGTGTVEEARKKLGITTTQPECVGTPGWDGKYSQEAGGKLIEWYPNRPTMEDGTPNHVLYTPCKTHRGGWLGTVDSTPQPKCASRPW